MSKQLALLFFTTALPLLAVWNYDYNPRPGTPNLSGFDSSVFNQNGTVVYGSPGSGQPNAMIGTGTSNGTSGSIIEKGTPYSTYEYEVSSVLRNQVSGGNFIQYVRSLPTSLNFVTQSGPFFTVELNNPVFTATGCMGTLNFWQSDGTNATLKASSQVPCYDHMEIRTVVFGNYVWTMINGLVYSAYCDITTGNPGIGLWDTPVGNGIERVQIGSRSLTAPAPIDRTTLGTSSFPDRVDMHWTEPPDVTGVGIFIHAIYRNGVYKDFGFNENDYTDNTDVAPNQTYSYQIYSTSFHGNSTMSPPIFTATTPGAGSIDPRRVGLKPNGSYWGALGENIDNLSGNLNFTVPLLQTKARGGWGIPISLSYNSQMWRKDNGGTWFMGQDVGYGMGWRLMAGSVTPAFNNQIYVIDHWTFTDSTGAEHRLNVNTGGVWTSTEATYVSFDANTDRLWFQNGSFWYMGCVSGGGEQDMGTRYPTLMQDKNGNQINLFYDGGLGTNYYNSSARILNIQDIRTTASVPHSYVFEYQNISRTDGGSDVIPHLTAIRSQIQTGETYYFYRASGQTLTSPWGDAYGNTDVLQKVAGAANPNNAADSNAPNRTYAFDYDASAQLRKATLPPGGYLRWDYLSQQYSSARNQMEVQNRYLKQDAPGQGTGQEAVYQISHGGTQTVHDTTNIIDPTGAAKVFSFTSSSANTWQIGLLTSAQKKASLNGALLEGNTVTWALSASNNPFVRLLQTQVDGQTSKTQQAIDQYGNMVEQDIWDYPASATQANRIYQYNYLGGAYVNYYVRNALTQKSVLDGIGQNPQGLGGVSYDQPCTAFSTPPPMTNAVLLDHTNRTDFLANPTQVTSPGNGRTCSLFDLGGQVYASEGPGKPRQEVGYAPATNFAAPSQVSLNQDSNSLSTFAYTPWLGLSGYTGPNNVGASYLYDSYGQTVSAFLSTGGRLQSAYYPGPLQAGFFPNVQNGYPWTKFSYIDFHWTRTTLDGLGRPIREEKGPIAQGGAILNATSIVDTEYGPCACSPVGKVKRQSQPYAPGGAGYWTTYTYDGMGRTLSVTGPDGSSRTTMTYNAQVPNLPAPPANGSSVTTVDPKGSWKVVTNDIFGNVTQVIEPNPDSAPAPFVTTYTYDKVDHLLKVEMPRPTVSGMVNQTRTFTYDPVHLKLMTENQPETGLTTYQYNQNNQVSPPHGETLLSNKTDAKGQVTVYDTYDQYNRLVKTRFLKPGGAEDLCQQINLTYDGYPGAAGLSTPAWGRMTTSQVGNLAGCKVDAVTQSGAQVNQSFLQAYSYTPAGQIALKRLLFTQMQTAADGTVAPITGNAWDTSYVYDDEGYQTAVTYPDGTTHRTDLDAMKRPISLGVGTSLGSIIASVQYNAADQVTNMGWHDYGVTEARTYNNFNQLTRILAQVGGGAAIDLNYAYGAAGQNNGQVSGLTSPLDGLLNLNYSYDSLNRLKTMTGAKTQTYSYDGWGNLYSRTGDGSNFTLGVDTSTNRLFGGGVCYDANGNMTGTDSGCSQNEFDMSNRLVRVPASSSGAVDGSGHTDQSREIYVYTADNKRVSTVRPNGNNNQVFYIYGAKNELGMICTSQFLGNAPVCETGGPRDVKFVGRLVRQNGAPVTVDRVGSVVANPVNRYARYIGPYGDQVAATSNNPMYPGNFEFANYLFDVSTNLHYADQRYYNGTYARFMSADPYRARVKGINSPIQPATWNHYSYVLGDPINFSDKTGRNASSVNSEDDPDPQPLPIIMEPFDPNEPYDPPPPTLPIYCEPDVIKAMIYAWGQSAAGTNGTEAGFRTDGTPEVGGYTVVRNNFTNQQMAQLMEVTNTTFAIFHVHPKGGDPKPSKPDQNIGNKYGIEMYTMSRQGLYLYDPNVGSSVLLRSNLDWIKPCPESKGSGLL